MNASHQLIDYTIEAPLTGKLLSKLARAPTLAFAGIITLAPQSSRVNKSQSVRDQTIHESPDRLEAIAA
jgi:hypothetical protein